MATMKYEIFDVSNSKSLGEVWWDEDKEEIKSSNPRVLAIVKKKYTTTVSFKDGKKFLEKLPVMFRNGYITVRKVN